MNAKFKKVILVCALETVLVGVTLAQTNVTTSAQASLTNAQASSGEEMADLARKLNNPAASLISVPLQNNFDFGGGPNDDGFQYRLNLQPVIPFKLNDEWKILSRTIIPYIYQEDRIGTGSQSGLGDSTVTLWLSPQAEKKDAMIWGLGPVFQLPTATDDLLGAEKWCVGPSAILLRQSHGWTMGVLAEQVWSFTGDDDRQDVNYAYIQPFISYTTKSHTTFGLNSESTYDWENEQWTVPFNLFVTQLVKIGKLPVSFQFGGRYYAEKPTGGPDWGLRFTVTFVLPE